MHYQRSGNAINILCRVYAVFGDNGETFKVQNGSNLDDKAAVFLANLYYGRTRVHASEMLSYSIRDDGRPDESAVEQQP